LRHIEDHTRQAVLAAVAHSVQDHRTPSVKSGPEVLVAGRVEEARASGETEVVEGGVWQQSVPSSLALAGGCGALVQVRADVARHGAQLICEFAQRGQTGLLGEGGAGLGQNTEAFADDLPGGLTVG
jgi:hypothetical protein